MPKVSITITTVKLQAKPAARPGLTRSKPLYQALRPFALAVPDKAAKVPWTDRDAHDALRPARAVTASNLRGLLNLWRSERSEESQPHNLSGDENATDTGTTEDERSRNRMAEAQRVTGIREVQGEIIPENQTSRQDAQYPVAGVALTPCLSVDRHMPESLPPGAQRLEQVRQRVLQSTRAYLGTDPQLRVNAQEPRGDGSEGQA
ncbi:uncharacterized protein PV07_03441 [Cladophialophora immunda]|uniref:Uncharacterized protein n=1 Tax=Cladophialophora immunda TaxID=569365 RepID=A0A0D1ZUP4_9EURO|nr:uncharacterized protein PV07_03441 [Cladophialophora immunda]KIW31851.1 hypothetical protein PV07_03441 [Cladophialophora immunda]